MSKETFVKSCFLLAPTSFLASCLMFLQSHCKFHLTPLSARQFAIAAKSLVTVNWGLILCLICIKAEEIGDK